MARTELLAPAGSFEVARAAFAAGADAVYLGLDAFSARAYAENFTEETLAQLVAYARALGRKVYVTFNTLVADGELGAALRLLARLEEIGPDALIVQDLGVARLVRAHFPSLALHASTQMAAHNLEGALLLKELGFSRVVLARELPLADVASIVRRAGVEIETFVHGALCYSLSGLCLFSALERGRSGNRGRCAYCCRQRYADASGRASLPFSMRDLRLDDLVVAFAEAGVASLKIEGRMKSALYVASVVSRYRALLDGAEPATSREDLETVFSRRTTELYARGWKGSGPVVDPDSTGHLGAPVGVVKRVVRDREGRALLRFRTSRALEKHDGLQFADPAGGRPIGFGIAELRTAFSRHPVCSVPAGTDVEVLLPESLLKGVDPEGGNPLRAGATVYCSASNEMKRRFPIPPFRPSEFPTGRAVDVEVRLRRDGAAAAAGGVEAHVAAALEPARCPERTAEAVRSAFARMGGTAWRLGALRLDDPEGLFAPASLVNDLRRGLVAKLDEAAAAKRRQIGDLLSAAADSDSAPSRALPAAERAEAGGPGVEVLKIRLGQPIPARKWDEIVVAVGRATAAELLAEGVLPPGARLALPVFTREADLNRLRVMVKGMLRRGWTKWEAADLGGLRLLRQLGAADVTADWTLYAFNREAVAALAELGVRRCVVSPEAESAPQQPAIPCERLVQQSTPLFISVTRPAADDPSHLTGERGEEYVCREADGLWATTRAVPRTWSAPADGWRRTDLSWDA